MFKHGKQNNILFSVCLAYERNHENQLSHIWSLYRQEKRRMEIKTKRHPVI